MQTFRPSVLAILDQYENSYKNSLENYLISLWMIIEKYKHDSPSYSLFVTMINEAFLTQPCEFNERWLAFDNDLMWEYQDDVLILKEWKNDEWVVTIANINDFEILQHTILFQIADLHRMPPEKLNDPQRFFGIQSPTDHTWYNFTPFDYWECATRGMEDHLRSSRSNQKGILMKCSWAALAELLSLGQYYE